MVREQAADIITFIRLDRNDPRKNRKWRRIMEQRWQDLKIIRDFYQIKEDGTMPEGSKILLDATGIVNFHTGEDIVTIGAEPDDGMYIILEGTTRTLLAGDEAVGEQNAGDVIGELALIKDGTRKATVRALTEVLCANIPRKVFDEIAHSNHKVYGALLELLYTKSTNAIRERERLRSELEVAAKIQAGMLPKSFDKFCRLPNLKLAAGSKPAKVVGGDFYDVFQIDENRLCFLIADVSGKGLPACLFMTVAKTHIKNYMMLGMPVAEAAVRVNDQLNEDNEEELFVTVFLSVLDFRDNSLKFVNAGHNKPAIGRGNGMFELLECRSDFVFGMMEDMTYREQKTTFSPGDRLFLYTDGVTEAFDKNEEMYTEERMLEALNRHKEVWEEPEQILTCMYRDLAEFSLGTEQSDDITMMYLVR